MPTTDRFPTVRLQGSKGLQSSQGLQGSAGLGASRGLDDGSAGSAAAPAAAPAANPQPAGDLESRVAALERQAAQPMKIVGGAAGAHMRRGPHGPILDLRTGAPDSWDNGTSIPGPQGAPGLVGNIYSYIGLIWHVSDEPTATEVASAIFSMYSGQRASPAIGDIICLYGVRNLTPPSNANVMAIVVDGPLSSPSGLSAADLFFAGQYWQIGNGYAIND